MYTIIFVSQTTFFKFIEYNSKTNPQGHKVVAVWILFLRSTWPSADADIYYNLQHVYCVDYNQCLCLLKAELNTKTNPNGHQPALINNYLIILIHNDRHVFHHLSIYWNEIQLQVGSLSS